METARDVLAIAAFGAAVVMVLGTTFGWIALGPAWWILAAIGVAGGVAKIALGLLAALADLLAGRRD